MTKEYQYKGYKIIRQAVKLKEAKEAGIKFEYWYLGEYGESEHYFSLKECKQAINEFEI